MIVNLNLYTLDAIRYVDKNVNDAETHSVPSLYVFLSMASAEIYEVKASGGQNRAVGFYSSKLTKEQRFMERALGRLKSYYQPTFDENLTPKYSKTSIHTWYYHLTGAWDVLRLYDQCALMLNLADVSESERIREIASLSKHLNLLLKTPRTNRSRHEGLANAG